MTWKKFIVQNPRRVIRGGFSIFEESKSLNILENDYADATRNKSELDERVFVNKEDSLLGSGSSSGGAMNISGAKRKIDSIASPTRTSISPLAPYCSPSASHAKTIPCGSNSKVKATPITTAMTTAKALKWEQDGNRIRSVLEFKWEQHYRVDLALVCISLHCSAMAFSGSGVGLELVTAAAGLQRVMLLLVMVLDSPEVFGMAECYSVCYSEC
ncbi:Retinoblastoma-related protein [Camellia lanceoleosa]|uniref:Retinoblastoma-related protein n=1 Tax=Camellia lanceoleosa TaxID=1840588 RepID=A0ACC0ITX0_9ERIC|nr:Retinoblastoma-related protein [Camellia lanceoleosa]